MSSKLDVLAAHYWERDDEPEQGVVYAPSDQKFAGYSPDNGQALTTQSVCTKWQCQKWDGDTPIFPKLVANERGFRICPVCGCSWGE